jgi:hypothetical protein
MPKGRVPARSATGRRSGRAVAERTSAKHEAASVTRSEARVDARGRAGARVTGRAHAEWTIAERRRQRIEEARASVAKHRAIEDRERRTATANTAAEARVSPAGKPAAAAKATAGGELTTAEFFRDADASPEVRSATAPKAAQGQGQSSVLIPDNVQRQQALVDRMDAAARSEAVAAPAPIVRVPATRRVDGFGAEGAVLTAKPVPDAHASSVAGNDAEMAEPAEDAPEAAGDAAARDGVSAEAALATALAHPTHQQMADAAVEPVVLPGLYRDGRLVVPAPLKGSREILAHQNEMADAEGLERIRNNDELHRLRAAHQLVDFPETDGLRVNPELSADRRCARVWTVKFAADVSRAFYARFHGPLELNSAVRTVAYQARLQRVNGNAAATAGELASPHLTGQAVDFGKHGMTIEEIAWMRAYLKPLMDAGKLDVEEEFQQACFHISVYRSYLPAMRRSARELATIHSSADVTR